MSKLSKWIHVIFMILGFQLGTSGVMFFVFNEVDESSLIFQAPPITFVVLALLGYLIFVYNLFSLIKKHDLIVYQFTKNKKSHHSSSSSSSYHTTSTTTRTTPKENKPSPAPKPNYPFDWYDLTKEIESISSVQVFLQNVYIEVNNVYVKTLTNYSFHVEVSFKARGSVTLRTETDVKSYKRNVEQAVDILENEIGDRVQSLHNKYGFGYEVSFTNIEDNVRYSYE